VIECFIADFHTHKRFTSAIQLNLSLKLSYCYYFSSSLGAIIS